MSPHEKLYLTILRGADPFSAVPVLACEDQALIRAAARVIGLELGQDRNDELAIRLVPEEPTCSTPEPSTTPQRATDE